MVGLDTRGDTSLSTKPEERLVTENLLSYNVSPNCPE